MRKTKTVIGLLGTVLIGCVVTVGPAVGQPGVSSTGSIGASTPQPATTTTLARRSFLPGG